MKPKWRILVLLVLVVAGGICISLMSMAPEIYGNRSDEPVNVAMEEIEETEKTSPEEPDEPTPEPATVDEVERPKPKPIPTFVLTSIDWLANAQLDNGGWGAGSNARQQIRDPKAVSFDPGTTAFTAMALLRSGNTVTEGSYAKQVNKALRLLLTTVEDYPEEGHKITNITGTQPQAKLGQNIDASLMVQFFSRVLPLTDHDANLEERVTAALDKCIRKIERSQNADGSVAGGSWAPVLQSGMASNSLEMARDMGRPVNEEALEKSKNYQKSTFNWENGDVKTDRAAGVALYAISSNQRATAKEANKAQRIVERGKKEGKLRKDAEVDFESLKTMDISDEEAQTLTDSYKSNKATQKKLTDKTVLAGFGNNGGEEYLSYLMTSESLVITGGEEWDQWNNKMHKQLAAIQNSNGTWSGHHCITSPVFCTAAVVLLLTADQDVAMLTQEKGDQSN